MIRTRLRTVAGVTVAATLFAAGSAAASTDTTTPTSDASGSAASTSDATATAAAAGSETTTAGSASDTAATSAGTAASGEMAPLDTTGLDAPLGEWAPNTDDCVDPEAANAPIEGEILIGSAMPLSGGPAAAAYAPVAQGLQSYIDYANENEMVPGVTLKVSVGDDQFNPELTPGVVQGLLDDGASLFAYIIGSGGNLAVRDLLNEECVPQLMGASGSAEFANVEEYPWSTGGLISYDIESNIYAADINRNFPDGATVGLYFANYEFGQSYQRAFEEIASDDSRGLEIVEEQTVEPGDGAPPQAQVKALAEAKPDAIVGVPVGAQCSIFLTELANALAANPDWTPRVYLSQVCASEAYLAPAGEAANGVLSAAIFLDLGNPDVVAANQSASDYMAWADEHGFGGDGAIFAAPGWNAGEVVVQAIRRAAESDAGLTRASIMQAFRSTDYHPSLMRPGVNFRLNGDTDGYLMESAQIVAYDVATGTFVDEGDMITEFESE